MKKVYALLFTLLVINTAFAQGNFERGSNIVNLGIGFGSSLLSGASGYSSSPGISASFERGIWEIPGPGIISLGGYIGFKSYKYEYDYYYYGKYVEKWNYTVIGVRGAYHYNGIKSDKFDVYGGVMVSFNILSYSNSNTNFGYYPNNYGSGAGGSLFIGGRYFLSKNFALYSELGYGVAYLNVGISFKF